MNLVVGATGPVGLGGEICRRLIAKGKPVRALVRATADRSKVEELQQLGVEFMEGDLKDRASIDAACRGVDTVISTATTTVSRQPGDTIETVDLEGQQGLVEAAKAAGVRRFVYVSLSGNITTDSPLTTAKRTVERQVRQSGMTHTILRPSYFMEVWLSPLLGFDFPSAKATIYGSGNNRVSWISLGDVAQFAVEYLDNPAAHDAIIELGGPEALSQLEVVQIFEDVGGRPFEVQHVPEEVLQEQKANAADSLQQAFTGLMLDYAKGDLIEMQKTLQTFPVRLASVRDYAKRVLA
jgi:uncharacterized protein YbjT (DUF2867 family)